ncbi:MAG TPA: hypothetical protein VMU24_09765 [Candidatus Acidoferrales bacterium]|nr:hypothetical protein [Candidatus Acidoferrales bacterium]
MCIFVSPGRTSGVPAPVPQRHPTIEGDTSQDPRIARDQAIIMEKARQEQQYKDMKRDAEKLLELATELNQEVERSNEHTLSLDVMKKAEQIEKLAHSVKTRMRGD